MPWPVSGPVGDYVSEAPKLPRRLGLVFNGRMAMLNFDVFEALKSAGNPEDKARKAAEALSQAAHASEVADIRSDVMDMKSTVKLHTWILGFNTAMLAAVLLRLFSAGAG